MTRHRSSTGHVVASSPRISPLTPTCRRGTRRARPARAYGRCTSRRGGSSRRPPGPANCRRTGVGTGSTGRTARLRSRAPRAPGIPARRRPAGRASSATSKRRAGESGGIGTPRSPASRPSSAGRVRREIRRRRRRRRRRPRRRPLRVPEEELPGRRPPPAAASAVEWPAASASRSMTV